MAIQWFRSWNGAPVDLKWLTIAKHSGVLPGMVSAIAWALLDHASQHEDRGSIEGFDFEGYSAFSGFEEAKIVAVVKAMTDKSIIADGRFKSWEKRQPEKEDATAAERKRRQRSRERREREAISGHALSRDVTTEQTKPKQIIPDQTKEDDKLPHISFLNRPFRIQLHLSNDEIAVARSVSPGWDIYHLMSIYDDRIKKREAVVPRLPAKAFIGWCQKFTKGLPPS